MTRFLQAAALCAACGLSLQPCRAGGTLRIFLLAGQSNMEGQAYTYDSAATATWNVPTMQFLLSGTAAATTYVANMPFGFKTSLNSGWLSPRADVWAVHYNSSDGTVKNVLPTNNPADLVSGIQPLQPGFGVGTGSGSMIGPELGMGIRLGDATADPVFLFKSSMGGTTLGTDWRPTDAVTKRGGTVGANYTHTMTRFIQFLDSLDADLGDDGVLNNYNNATAYQVSGVFWFQGWNEQYDDAPYTAAQLQAEYKDNLVDLIHSIRAADPRIGGSVGLIVGESADQNATLNAARIAAVAELNGEIANSAAYFDTDNMIGANWGNNDGGAPFSTGWGYHYNARAENYLEIGWRAAGAALDNGFLSPSPLWFATPVVTSATTSQATASAYLNAAADNVTVVWDTSDKGPGLTTDWAHQQSLGPQSAGQVQHILTSLAEGSGYTVRFHATSASPAAETWSAAVSFTTPWLNPPPVLGVPTVSSVISQGATLKCQLQQADANVTLVWAYADQGTNSIGDWTGAAGGGSFPFGATTAETELTHALTGLVPATSYAYRFYATNPYGTVWTAAKGFATTMAGTGGGSAHLVGYWNFDNYTTGSSNPAGLPQATGDAGEGYFDDLSVNGQRAYGADFSGLNQVPFQAGAGRFGGAFYSETPAASQNGALAVIKHTDAINFNQESFTISFWEKSQYRNVAGTGWAPGRGRSQFFTKAPWLPNDPDNVILDGYGLNLTQNAFAMVTNKDGDNYGQDSLGVKYTFPTGTTPAFDSGTWAHWAITGQYNAGTDNYTMTIYLNGVAVDWDGATGTTFTVPNAIIDNPGDLTIGQFFRNNGWSAQRFISWSMTDGTPEMGSGKAWMDDFAMWDVALTTDDIAALAAGIKGPLDIGVATGYSDWADTNAPTTGNSPNADEDEDGVSNGLEFVLGGTIATNDLDKLPTASEDGTDMTFEFVRDQDSVDGSTVVTIEVGTDLVTWPGVYTVGADTGSSSPGVAVVDNLDGTDTITLTVTMAPDTRKFGRLKAVVTP
jgi:hypothetical protein